MDEKFSWSTNLNLLAHTKTEPFQSYFYLSPSSPIYQPNNNVEDYFLLDILLIESPSFHIMITRNK
ncbi:hypothetical protein HanRHA438_Chr03g0107161 [Helianthus annuus]|nr:hypothetical protein HanRHA438_Chr03g0107161 [Helianthus annuus]